MLLVVAGRKDATLHVHAAYLLIMWRGGGWVCSAVGGRGGGTNSSTMNDDSRGQEAKVIKGRKVILLVTFSAV